MRWKTFFRISIFIGVILWINPSLIFHERSLKIELFYYGFSAIMAALYAYEFIRLKKIKTGDRYELLLIYLSLMGYIFVLAMTIVYLAAKNIINIQFIPTVLVLRVFIVFIIFLSYNIGDNEKLIGERYKKYKNSKRDIKVKKNKKNKWFYKILIKNFKYNFKDYIVFIVSSVLAITYIYGFIGNLIIVNTIQKTELYRLTEGITMVVLNALVVIAIVTTLIQFYALKNYVQNRVYDFSIFTSLGMKKRDIQKSIVFLISVSLVISFIIGTVLGNFMIYGFRRLYGFYLNSTSIPDVNILMITGVSFIICVVLFGVIMSITQDMAIETSMVDNVSTPFIEEKYPKRNKKLIVFAALLLLFSITMYSDPHWAESMYFIYIWLIGIFILIYIGASYILQKLKNKNDLYLKNILNWNLMFYKPKSYLKNTFTLYVILFIMFFTYMFQITSLYPLESKGLYPYDYVSLGYPEDRAKLESIGDEFNVENHVYPVVRALVPGGEEKGNGNLYKNIPMGHHLGISEGTYKDITGKSLDLKGKDVYVLFQEDKSKKAHPLDFFVRKNKPYIRVGKAQQYHDIDRKYFFNLDYNLKGEDREIVFGRLSNFMYENIIVFSDEYFNVQRNKSDGIKWISTIKSKDKNDDALDEYLNEYEKKHKQESSFDYNVESVYSAKDLYETFQGEKIFDLIINISILISFSITSILIVFVYTFGNLGYYQHRYELLRFLGLRKEESDSVIKREVRMFSVVPLMLSLITAILFIGITLKIRRFSYTEFVDSFKLYFGILALYLAIYFASSAVISRFIIKNIDSPDR